jgi:inhibitor of cysteine peptidase
MRVFAALVLAVGLISTAGCATASPPPRPPPGPVTLTNADAGSVVLVPGQELRVELALSAGTGYAWRLDREADPAVLSGGSSRTTNAALPGGRVVTLYSYQAAGRGSTDLSFTLKQPWMPDADSDTRRMFKVMVR